MKLKKLLAGLAIGLTCVAASAQTQIIRFQDDDVDFLLAPNSQGGLSPKTSGTFAKGDVLVSVFEMPDYTIDGVNKIPSGKEVTGIAAIQIKSISGTGIGGVITFEPYSGGLNAISPVDVTNGGAGEGAIVAMWMNDTATFDLKLDFATNPAVNCTSYSQCLDEASKGDLLQVDGFAGDLDEFWSAVIVANGGADPSVVGGIAGSINVAVFNAALTTFFNSTGPIAFQEVASGNYCPSGTMALDGCVQGPTVTGPISGGNGLNSGIKADGAFARSDIDASKLQLVPEPGSLALVGLSLLGLAAVRRRAS